MIIELRRGLGRDRSPRRWLWGRRSHIGATAVAPKFLGTAPVLCMLTPVVRIVVVVAWETGVGLQDLWKHCMFRYYKTVQFYYIFGKYHKNRATTFLPKTFKNI